MKDPAKISAVARHFEAVDPVIAAYVRHLSSFSLGVSGTPFLDLVEAIINQQLSEKAGATIFSRFKASFGGTRIVPEAVLGRPAEELRSIGVSWSKVAYIRALAQAVSDGQLILTGLVDKEDEEIIASLTNVKGIGRWTAEMFLMFSLGREDVFSYGDLGLRNAIRKLYGIKKDPTPKQMERIVTRWKPYRTYGARLLWKSLELT